MFHVRYPAIFTIFLIICHCRTNAQPFYFRHYQVENGLSNSTVFCSTQDKYGFLWFGTREGLNRFDGYHFKLFNYSDKLITHNDNLSIHDSNEKIPPGSDMIYCLFSDPGGSLWVGGRNGLFLFDRQQEKMTRLLDSLTEINWIQTDDKGNLWFLSTNNVYRYNLTTHQLKHFPIAQYFYATSICKADDGGLWFSTSNGLIERFNEGTETFTAYDLFAHSPVPDSRWLSRIRFAGKGRFLIGTTSQGLKIFDATNSDYKDLLTRNPDKSTIYVRDILPYSASECWLATESGIYIVDINTGRMINLRKNFTDPYSLSDNAIYALCRDSEGGVWAGTYFGGVNYYSRQYSSFQKYFPDNTQNSISGSAVREICQDAYHNIWIGTEDAGLNKLDIKTGAITHYLPSGSSNDIAYSNIHGLLCTGNEIWIGTFEHGLDVMNIRTGKVIRHYMAGPRPNDLKSNFVLSLIKTNSGRLVLGTSNGVYWYNEKTNDFTPISGIPSNLFAAIVMEDHDGRLWIGSHGSGVYYYNRQTGQTGHLPGNVADGNGLSSPIVNAITEDSDHNIWFSTEGGGLCRLGADRKTYLNYTTANGLPSNFIFRLIEDNNKNYWVTTSKGLANLHRSDEQADQQSGEGTDHQSGNRADLRTDYTMIIYTRANGLLNDQFNYNSGFKDKDGKLYFGSVKGMITFNPGDFVHNSFIPPIYITGIQVNNQEQMVGADSSFLKKSIACTDTITLPHDQSTFSIDFAALYYATPERTEYAYMMEGLEKSPTLLKNNRKIYFTNLAPGFYVFKLRAAVDGLWSQQEKRLFIRILPPFLATTPAFIFYALMIILLGWYIVRGYHRRTQIKKEKEIYGAKIEFFTNIAHEIRTPLTLIKGPAENLREQIDAIPAIKEDVITLERNTNRLISLVTQILDFRQTETGSFSLDLTRVNITEILQETWLNFDALARKRHIHFRFEHPTADIYAIADEEALIKIFSNLLSNAVKYGQQQVLVRLFAQGDERPDAGKNVLNDKKAGVPANNHSDILIEIVSDGPVIPEDMKERIFEPFFRMKNTSPQPGTGIGLALARSLAELHKGRICLDNRRHPGLNTFIFILPAQSQWRQTDKTKSTYQNLSK
jgi:signal transduction histidine kinase/ligand-binding sensor domain-containing protein